MAQNEKNIDRRGFLKSAAAAALTAGLVGTAESQAFGRQPKPYEMPPLENHELQPHPIINERRGSEYFWKKVRETFLLPDDYIHMNTGTTGSQPRFSFNNRGVYNLYKSMDPKDWEANLNERFPDLFPLGLGFMGAPSATAARQEAIAEMYGADPEEIVLSYNTTDACNIIFAGTPWKPGDRIITTHWEHPALVGPINWTRDYNGVEVSIVRLPSNFTDSITVGDVLSLFEEKLKQPLRGEKQYIAVSEIFYKNGLRLPVKELARLARKYGAYTIIDTAHGWGMIPIDCHDYGVDFIAGAGHKWLCGGPGTGICYVRTKGGDLPPFNMGNWFLYGFAYFFPEPAMHFNSRDWAPSTFMQFRGEVNSPALYAMTDAAAYWNYLGLRDIYDRGVALGNYLKDKIADKWGKEALWVQKNRNKAFATFLTSFNPFADKNDSTKYDELHTAVASVVNILAEENPKIYIRYTDWHDQPEDAGSNRVGFRVSTHAVYNNYEEIDYFFDRLVAAVDATGVSQLG